MPNPFRVRKRLGAAPNAGPAPAPQVAENPLRIEWLDPNWPERQRQVRELQQQIQQQMQGMPLPRGFMEKPIKPPKIFKPTRALPAGRMRSVKLGDILEVYQCKDNPRSEHFTMIDFRSVKGGDYYLDTRFNVQQAAKPMASPRIIIELAKGKKRTLFEDDYEEGRMEMREPG